MWPENPLSISVLSKRRPIVREHNSASFSLLLGFESTRSCSREKTSNCGTRTCRIFCYLRTALKYKLCHDMQNRIGWQICDNFRRRRKNSDAGSEFKWVSIKTVRHTSPSGCDDICNFIIPRVLIFFWFHFIPLCSGFYLYYSITAVKVMHFARVFSHIASA